MITLIKNKDGIGYKITLGRVGIEKSIELGLEKFGRVGFGVIMGTEKFFSFLNFIF